MKCRMMMTCHSLSSAPSLGGAICPWFRGTGAVFPLRYFELILTLLSSVLSDVIPCMLSSRVVIGGHVAGNDMSLCSALTERVDILQNYKHRWQKDR